MANIYTSRFITIEDEMTDICLLRLPPEWWNRPYEYRWAMNFIEKSDICLDAGCGLPHPFKFYLSSECDNVYACDLSENILLKENILISVANFFSIDDIKKASMYVDKVHFSVANLNNLPYEDNMFTKIFCISVLKFLSLYDIELVLKEFYRSLKPNGYLLLTLDVPSINLNVLTGLIYNTGFRFVGNLDLVKPKTAICSPLPICLNCFRFLLAK